MITFHFSGGPQTFFLDRPWLGGYLVQIADNNYSDLNFQRASILPPVVGLEFDFDMCRSSDSPMITTLHENLHKSFFRNPAQGAESNVPATYPGLSLGHLEHLYFGYGLYAIVNPIKLVGPPPILDTQRPPPGTSSEAP
ncbi:hypothetical protein BKA82DRAFT_34613 [Pisolithus tinctorius]|nr:hypothetical protein BKA82DRAFT_34613 [Pisolithus tinctorius]